MRLTYRIERNEYVSYDLRSRVKSCGRRFRDGLHAYCRTVCCDRCRRYRAKITARAAVDWVGRITATHRLYRLEAVTGQHTRVVDLLREIDHRRRAMRNALDYRARRTARWQGVQYYGVWMPSWDGSAWSARLQGLIYLNTISETTFLEAFANKRGVRLVSFGADKLVNHVHDYVFMAFSVIPGAVDCVDYRLAELANEFSYHKGYKALISRRGMQAQKDD